MRLEVLFLDGCPNHEPLLARVPALLHAAGSAEGVSGQPSDQLIIAAALG